MKIYYPDSDTVTGIFQSYEFVNQMDFKKENPNLWNKVPTDFKDIYKRRKEGDNPILMVTKLKEDIVL